MVLFDISDNQKSVSEAVIEIQACICDALTVALFRVKTNNTPEIPEAYGTEYDDTVTPYSSDHFTPWSLTTFSQFNSSHNLTKTDCSFYQKITNRKKHLVYKLAIIFYTYVCSSICIFGFLGNLANVFLLIPQGRKCSMGRMEKSVYWGLISLAFSDLMFCLCVIPRMIIDVDQRLVTDAPNFSLLYFTYSDASVHLFAMISTWLTVAMAVGRYLAICKPFTARAVIGRTAAKRTIAGIFVICFLVSLPRFFFYTIESINCGSSFRNIYFRWPMYNVSNNSLFDQMYNWFYFLVGIIIPFACLIFSNAFLIKTLDKAKTTLKYCRVVKRNQSNQNQSSQQQQQQQQQPQQQNNNSPQQQQQQQQQQQHINSGNSNKNNPRHSSNPNNPNNKFCSNNSKFLHQKLQQRYTPVHLYSPSLQPQKHNYYYQFVQHQQSTEPRSVDQYRPITLTLIVLVLTYVILVTPSEIFLFVRKCLLSEHNDENYIKNFLGTIANTLQATNYSLNFLLYYAINVNFRKSVTKALCCLRNISINGCTISLTSIPMENNEDNGFDDNLNNSSNNNNNNPSSSSNNNDNNSNHKNTGYKTSNPSIISSTLNTYLTGPCMSRCNSFRLERK